MRCGDLHVEVGFLFGVGFSIWGRLYLKGGVYLKSGLNFMRALYLEGKVWGSFTFGIS